MTGRPLAIGAAFCLTLLPGCSHTAPRPAAAPAVVSSVASAKALSDPQATSALTQPVPPLASPYHPSRVSPEDPLITVNEGKVAQAQFPLEPPHQELLPEPRPSIASSSQAPTEVRLVVSSSTGETKTKPVEDPPLVSALRCFLDKRPADALAWLQHYDKPSQDLLLCLLPLLAQLAEGRTGTKDRREVTASLAQLNQVAAALRPLAELSIEKMCFCWTIEKYGVYRPVPHDHEFRPENGCSSMWSCKTSPSSNMAMFTVSALPAASI
jgi:hypothetical protein